MTKEKTQAERLKLPTGNEGGIVVQSVPQEDGTMKIHYNPGKVHHLVIGTTGSYKTQGVILPSILSIAKTDGSMIVNDIKGELYALTSEYLKKKGYKVFTMDYFEPGSGSCFNQLFLVEEEYEKGLPHFYCVKAIDELLKVIDFLASGGQVNNLEFFGVNSTNYSRPQLPPSLAKYLTKGRYITTGIGQNAKVTLLMPIPSPKINWSPNIHFDDTKTLIHFLYELLANTYNAIQEDAKTKKGMNGDVTLLDVFYENEDLRVRQEHTVQAAADILNVVSDENIILYYQAKIEQNKAIVEAADPTTSTYKIASEYMGRYQQMVEEVKKDGISISNFRQFLVEMRADHETVWNSCENNASTYSDSVAEILIGDKTSGGDDFWNKTAKSFIKSVILLVCRESYLPYSKHMGSVRRVMSILGRTEQEQGSSTSSTKFDKIVERFHFDDLVRAAATDELNAPDRTKASIVVSATAPVSIFDNYEVVDQGCRNDFNPEIIATDKVAVFMVAPGRDDIGSNMFSVLATLLIEEVYSVLNRYLSQTKEQTLPRPVYFLLDEMANLAVPIKNLGAKISLARSKNIRFVNVLQSYEQLESPKTYKEEAETIKENSQIFYILSNNNDTAKALSERIGKTTIEQTSYTMSERDNSGNSSSTNTSSTARDLMDANELMKMKEGKAVYFIQRENPYRTTITPAWKWPIYKWLKANQVPNVHVRRNVNRDINFFVPDPTDFTFAYENLCTENGGCIILDKFIYNLLKSLEVQPEDEEPELPAPEQKSRSPRYSGHYKEADEQARNSFSTD